MPASHKVTLTLLLFLLSPHFLLAQRVSFAISPAKAWVRVDGKTLELQQQSTLTLAPGNYRAEVWAPNFKVEEVSFTVKNNETTIVRHGLKEVSPAYTSFKEARSEYKTQTLKTTITDVTLVGGTLGLGYFTLQAKSSDGTQIGRELALTNERIDQALQDYQNAIAPVDISRAEENYMRQTAEYADLQRKQNTRIVAGASLTALGVGLNYLYFTKWRKKRKPPEYSPTNPFVITPNHLRPVFGYTGTRGKAGVTFTF